MNVSYAAPLELAFARMTRSLFRPFDFTKWIVFGFAAWLAGLGERGGAGGGLRGFTSRGTWTDRGPSEIAEKALAWLASPWVIAAIFVGVLVVAAILTVCAWISSRAKFIYLDAVVYDRAAIVEPWNRFRRLGNSLFVWRIGFGVAVLSVIFVCMLPLLLVARVAAFEPPHRAGSIVVVLVVVALVLVVAIAASFVRFWLEAFVVPLMYRDDATASQAWRKLMPLLASRPWTFVGFALFVFVLAIALGIAITIVGCATCCLGFVLLIIPFVGSVVLLPVSFTYRAYGPEFLAQFGPEYTIFPERLVQPAPAQ